MTLLHSLVFLPQVPTFASVMAMVNLLAMLNGGVSEMRGNHGQYSKLVSPSNSGPKIRSKLGMTFFYFPAFAFGAASFFIFPSNYFQDTRFFLLRAAITLHFLKRLLETWFIHKYSGEMTIDTMLICGRMYLLVAFNIIYFLYMSCELPELSIDLKYVGLILFLVRITGNLYHHYLLSTLRREDEKEYKIPKGGLFGLVICPHYLFEVLDFWGLAFIAQTLCALSLTVAVTVYLMGRSHATRKWYVSKFEDFPTNVKAIIPYFF